jgi:3-phosphoshikimate 1-carboxyvinyltransferase
MIIQKKPFRLIRRGPAGARIIASPDKSCSQRALLFGLLAEGNTQISNLLRSGDVHSTKAACIALGARVIDQADGRVVVEGVGMGGLRSPLAPLDFGNSGTGCRLTMGLVAGQGVSAMFIGDESLSRRPMQRISAPLRAMGAEIEGSGDFLPMRFHGGKTLRAIDYSVPVASAQVKSAILLAGLGARGTTIVREAHKTRPHTEEMLAHFGVKVNAETEGSDYIVTLEGGQRLKGAPITVPGDPSSAAFLIALALMLDDSDVEILNILSEPTRAGFLRSLEALSGSIEITSMANGLMDLRVTRADLLDFHADPAFVGDMIDEFPIFAVLTAMTRRGGTFSGLSELRVKESDRIETTVAMLRAAGIGAEERTDGIYIPGRAGSAPFPGGGTVFCQHDHRIAMSAAVLSLVCSTPLVIDDASMIATSYPDFFDHLSRLGIEKQDLAP